MLNASGPIIYHQHMRKAGGTALRNFIKEHKRNSTKYVEVEWVPLPVGLRSVAQVPPDSLFVTSFAAPIARIIEQYLFEGGIGQCRGNGERFSSPAYVRSCASGAQLSDYTPFGQWLSASRSVLHGQRPDWGCHWYNHWYNKHGFACTCCDPTREHWPLPKGGYKGLAPLQQKLGEHYLGRLYTPNYYIKMLVGLPPADVATRAHLTAARATLRRLFSACVITERLSDGAYVASLLANLSSGMQISRDTMAHVSAAGLAMRSGGATLGTSSDEVGHESRERLAIEVVAAYPDAIGELRDENALDLELYHSVLEEGC